MKKEEKQNYNIASEIPNPHFSGVRLTIFFLSKLKMFLIYLGKKIRKYLIYNVSVFYPIGRELTGNPKSIICQLHFCDTTVNPFSKHLN